MIFIVSPLLIFVLQEFALFAEHLFFHCLLYHHEILGKLNNPRLKDDGFPKLSTQRRLPFPSFRRMPESRHLFVFLTKTSLDAGLPLHDKPSLRLRARDFNHFRERH